jgi:hypothetical protein
VKNYFPNEKFSKLGKEYAMKKIPCVDDDYNLLPPYRQEFSEERCQVLLAGDGDKALSKFVKEKPRHRLVRLFLLLQVTGAALLLLLADPNFLFAQIIMPLEMGQGLRFSASAGSSYQFKSDVTGGGDFSVSRYSLMAGGLVPIDEKIGIGFGFTYDFEDYDFSNLKGFPVENPWNKIDRVGLGVRLTYKVGENWGLHVGPIVQYAGERGANFDDSLMYGGVIAATYRASRDFAIGFGAGVFYRLEETTVFPSLLVSWKITDRLYLGNSYRLGPVGPAGLEVTYFLDKDWQLGAGGGYRWLRFRLDSTGPIPSGIGENVGFPVYLRLSRTLWQTINIDLFGGAVFGGKLGLEDSRGNEMNSISYNTAPLVGLSLRGNF